VSTLYRIRIFAAIALLLPFSIRAQEKPDTADQALVVLVDMSVCCPDEAWPEAETRIKAELEALNLKVEVTEGIASGEADRRAELEVVARDRNAACALRIIRSPGAAEGQVELWITDRITRKTTFRSFRMEREAGPDPARIMALRTVEALQASLLEIRIKSDRSLPAHAEALVPAPIAALVDRVKMEEPRVFRPFGMGAGITGFGSPGGAGGLLGVTWAFEWSFSPSFSLEVDGLVSVTSQGIESHGSASSFDLAVFRLWGFWEILDRGILRPSLGLGLGPAVPWVQGLHAGDRPLYRDATAVSAVGITARIGLVLSDRVWLRLGLRTSLLLPEIHIDFADRSVADFGMPLVEGFVLLEPRF